MSHPLPPGLLPALIPLLVVVLGLDVYCLVDLARAPSVRGAPKIVWAVIILFVSAPLGAILYLFVGRDRDRRAGRSRGATPPVPPPPPQHQSTMLAHGNSPLVTTSGLTKDYGGTGLFDVNLHVPAGSVYGLAGPNGAGTVLTIHARIMASSRQAS
jgi:hypothetical protein